MPLIDLNIRGTRSLRHLSLFDWPCGRYHTSEFHYLDTRCCMGGPRTMSRSLDCCQTLPWAATTFDRRNYGGLLYGVDENSLTLLCEVSSYCENGFSLPLKDWIYQLCFCFLLQHYSQFVSNTLNGMSIFRLPLHATTIHRFYRDLP